PVDLSGRKCSTYLRIHQCCLAQIQTRPGSKIAEFPDGALRLGPSHVRCQGHRERFRHDEPVREIQIRSHTSRIDLKSAQCCLSSVNTACSEAEKVRDGCPFRLPPSRGSLMLLRHSGQD